MTMGAPSQALKDPLKEMNNVSRFEAL